MPNLKTLEEPTKYRLFICLNVSKTLHNAINFENEDAYDNFVNELSNLISKPTYDVGIKQIDGTITTETFKDFKLRFFQK